jgi:Domain of unknown function (DUF4397)
MNSQLLKLSTLAVPALLMMTACNTADRTARNAERTARATDEGTRARTNDTKFAYVRFVDGFDKPANLYFGDEKEFTGDYKSVSDYKRVPAERREFALRDEAHTAGDPLAKNSEGLGDGKYYTVIAWGDKDDKPTLRVVNDNESAPASGKAKIRIIHAAPGMDAVDLYASGHKDKIASESRFTTASNWQEVDPVTGPLELRTSNKKDNPVRISNVTLQPGKMYTFVVVGGEKAGDRVNVVSIIDNPKDTAKS